MRETAEGFKLKNGPQRRLLYYRQKRPESHKILLNYVSTSRGTRKPHGINAELEILWTLTTHLWTPQAGRNTNIGHRSIWQVNFRCPNKLKWLERRRSARKRMDNNQNRKMGNTGKTYRERDHKDFSKNFWWILQAGHTKSTKIDHSYYENFHSRTWRQLIMGVCNKIIISDLWYCKTF